MFIKAAAERIWEAITTPEFTARYFHGARITVADGRYASLGPDGEQWGDESVHRVRPAAPARPRLAVPLRHRHGRRAGQPRDLGDRAG